MSDTPTGRKERPALAVLRACAILGFPVLGGVALSLVGFVLGEYSALPNGVVGAILGATAALVLVTRVFPKQK